MSKDSAAHQKWTYLRDNVRTRK